MKHNKKPIIFIGVLLAVAGIRWFIKHIEFWHWQNLSEEENTDLWPRHGRAWIHWINNGLCFEWSLFRRRCGIEVEFSTTDEDDVLFGLSIPFLFSIWLRVERFPLVNKLPGVQWKEGDHYSGHREISFSVHDRAIWWRLWRHPHIGNAHDKRDSSFDIADFFLGRAQYLESQRIRQPYDIAFPEGNYKLVIELYKAVWLRPRWPFFPQRLQRANIEIEGGIPVPGNLDSDFYDGDDALYGMTCVANSYQDAIDQVRESVMRDRNQSPNWVPDAGWPAHCIRKETA